MGEVRILGRVFKTPAKLSGGRKRVEFTPEMFKEVGRQLRGFPGQEKRAAQVRRMLGRMTMEDTIKELVRQVIRDELVIHVAVQSHDRVSERLVVSLSLAGDEDPFVEDEVLVVPIQD